VTLPPVVCHQWWCAVGYGLPDPCSCLPAWLAYERTRLEGLVLPRPLSTAIVEGPPCLACEGKAEQTEPSGERVPCARSDGTRHPACRGNGGGRMSPAAWAAWTGTPWPGTPWVSAVSHDP
jgi:hypothetical protein